MDTTIGSVKIKEVRTNSDIKKFVEFPLKLYKGSPYFVPPFFKEEYHMFRNDKNPGFEYCDVKIFLAYKDNKIVGRVCALHNKKYNEVWNSKKMRFTRFDFIDDFEVSSALISQVEKYAAELGLNEVHGPIGFCDLDKQGMLVEGFDEINMMITPYNYEYYIKHMEKLGYAKDVDWIEFLINVPKQLDEKLLRVADISLKRYKLKLMKPKNLREILGIRNEIFDLIYDAYKNLYGVVPLNDKQVQMYINQFISFVTPEYVAVILNENNEPVSFGVCVPSLVNSLRKTNGRLFPFGFISVLRELKAKKVDRIEMLLVATKPEYQFKGLNGIIITEIFKTFQKKKVSCAESGPMLEINDKIQAMWNRFENRQHKRRRCYIKQL